MITLRYDKGLDAGSVPAVSDFAITVNGTPDVVTSVVVSASSVVLGLTTAPASGNTVLASYTPGVNPIQDVAGNDAAAFTGQVVTGATPSSFGSLLPARIAESTGPVVNVATLAQLQAALSSAANGSIINITSSMSGGGSILSLTRNASAGSPITITSSPGVLITGFGQWNVRGSYLRLRGLNIGYGTIDGIKIDTNAHHIEVDGCTVHHAARQGINVQPSPTDIQIWNNTIHTNGSQVNVNLDHGTYWAYASGDCIFANNLAYNNCSYGLQVYPNSSGVIVTCNTLDGGQVHAGGRGGMVIGSESGLTDNVKVIGLLGTNAPWYAIDLYNPSGGDAGNNAYDSLGFGNGRGDFQAGSGMTYTNCTHADPLYVNAGARNYHLQAGSPAISKIQAARYGYVPPTDKDGVTRVTADAGCYAV